MNVKMKTKRKDLEHIQMVVKTPPTSGQKKTHIYTRSYVYTILPKTKKIFGQLMLQINSKTTHYKCDLIAPLAPPNLCPHFVT